MGLSGEEKYKIDFQNGGHDGHLGFPTGMILELFNLQFSPILTTEFRIIWPFCSGKQVQNKFKKWPFHKVKQRRSRLVAGWVTAVLDFVEDPTNT